MTMRSQPAPEKLVCLSELPVTTNALVRCIVSPSQKVKTLIADQDSGSIIDLSCQRLTDADMVNVIKYAVQEKQCKMLNLWGNLFTADSMTILVKSLCDNQTLKELDLADNLLGDDGVKIICQFLALNRCAIQEIDLSSNNIADAGAEYLGNMLARNDTLTILSLNDNGIDDDGLQRLAEGIRDGNKRLVQLRLESNPLITSTGVRRALRELRRNQTLQGVYVKGCDILEPEVKEDLRKESFRTGFDVFV